MSKLLFWLLAWGGRPFGGIRPRRLTHWAAKKAYGTARPVPSDFRWYRDRYGSEFLLHPHYYLDYNVIAFGTYDARLARLIERRVRPGMVCLDVGANIGVVALHLARRVGPSGAVHCFEPVPGICQRLREHVERNDLGSIVHVHPVALSDTDGKAVIHVADDFSANQGQSSLVNADRVRLPNPVTIPTMTLDEFVRREGLGRIDLIKVDIQGAEPLFLKGAAAALQRLRPDLCLEISPEDLAGLGQTSRDLLRQIEEMGYRVFRVTDGGDLGDRVRWDAVPADYADDLVFCTFREG
jgi:FkbM family methyltransferase